MFIYYYYFYYYILLLLLLLLLLTTISFIFTRKLDVIILESLDADDYSIIQLGIIQLCIDTREPRCNYTEDKHDTIAITTTMIMIMITIIKMIMIQITINIIVILINC